MSTRAFPVIGMIVPPAAPRVPREARELFPTGVDFIARGLGLAELAPDAYDEALERLDDAVDALVADGADAVSLMGTSISFYRGSAGHDEIQQRLLDRAGGRPVSTMSVAIVNALRHFEASRVALGSPYSETVATALAEFLTARGFRVDGSVYLGLTDIPTIQALDDDDLTDLGTRTLAENPGSDSLVLSCGALHTQLATERLHRAWGKPIVSSSQAGCWDAVRLVAPDLAGSPAAWAAPA